MKSGEVITSEYHSMAVTVQHKDFKNIISINSNLESAYDVTADDWHAHWHEESDAERLKKMKRLDWYTRPKDFATVGYRGMHQNKIEYSAADHERFHRHRAAFAVPNAHKADNQTSSRLFRDAEPEVRLPAASVGPLTVKANPSSAVSAPITTPPHLRKLPACSARCDIRSDLKHEDPIDHAQASESRTAALTVKNGENSPDSCCGDDKSTSTLIKSIRHLLASIESSGPCLPSVVPKVVSALKEGHAFIKDAQLQYTQSIAASSPPTTLQATDDVCPICDGSYTHDEPGMSTPCCGLLIHHLCNFEALEAHGRCHGCHGDQAPADISEPGSPSETNEYIRHFETNPQSFSPRSLKSEQAGASSTSSAVMTLREYVESQASTRFGTSSIATDKSSASSSSWLSSVEDDEYDEEDSSPVVIVEDPSCRGGPPLPTHELDPASRATMPHSSFEEQCRILQSIKSNNFRRGPSTTSSPNEKRAPGAREEMKENQKPMVTYEIIGHR